MTAVDPILLVLLTVGAVVVLALLGAQVHQRRTNLLRQAADELGFSFRETDPELAAASGGLALFSQAQATHAVNVMRGEAHGLEVLVFDYQYYVRVGNHTQHRRLSVLAFNDREADWPKFSLHPRRFYHRLAAGEIAFADDPAFAKAYLLHGSDEAAVRELFNDDVRHFFAQHAGAGVEGAGQRLVYCTGRLIDADQLRPFLEEGFRVKNVLQSGGQAS
jgi:hypothetical protein